MEQNTQYQNPQAIDTQANEMNPADPQTIEKKNLSRKRIFFAILGIDAALLAFLLFEIISLFF